LIKSFFLYRFRFLIIVIQFISLNLVEVPFKVDIEEDFRVDTEEVFSLDLVEVFRIITEAIDNKEATAFKVGINYIQAVNYIKDLIVCNQKLVIIQFLMVRILA